MAVGRKGKPRTDHVVFGTKIGEGCDAVNPNDLLELMVRAEFSPEQESHDEETENSKQDSNQAAERKPIVSINGKDVDERELEKPANDPNKKAA